MQHLEVSGAVRPLQSSLGVKRLNQKYTVLVCNTQVSTVYLLYVSVPLGHYQGASSNYKQKCINIK